MDPKNVFLPILSLVGFAIAYAYAWRRVFKRRTTSANTWLLPFAYWSLSSWIFWALQYVILVAGPLSSVPRNLSLRTGLWLGVMENVLWVVAILSLYLKQFSKVSLTLPLLILISVVIALITSQTPILTSEPFTQVAAASAASIFMILAASILQLRVSKLTAVIFFIHGYCQWIWRYLWFTPLGEIQIILFPLWYIALLITWITLISEMLVTSRVMISSTVRDLAEEREAVDRAIRRLNLEGFRAETIGSRPYTPKALCALWAEQCNIFILIIGERYGHIIKSKKISVVEFEYNVACDHDPGKILVYIKDGVTREPALQKFVDRLKDFEDGWVKSSFTKSEELYPKIQQDVTEWLASQAKQNNQKDWA